VSFFHLQRPPIFPCADLPPPSSTPSPSTSSPSRRPSSPSAAPAASATALPAATKRLVGGAAETATCNERSLGWANKSRLVAAAAEARGFLFGALFGSSGRGRLTGWR
jgi:hypothetical protein